MAPEYPPFEFPSMPSLPKRGRGRPRKYARKGSKIPRDFSPAHEPTHDNVEVGYQALRTAQGLPKRATPKKNKSHGVYIFNQAPNDVPKIKTSNARKVSATDKKYESIMGRSKSTTSDAPSSETASSKGLIRRTRDSISSVIQTLISPFATVSFGDRRSSGGDQASLGGAEISPKASNEGRNECSAPRESTPPKLENSSRPSRVGHPQRVYTPPKVEITSQPNRPRSLPIRGSAPQKVAKSARIHGGRPTPSVSVLPRSQRAEEQKVIAGRIQPHGWNPSLSELAGTSKVRAIDMQDPSFTLSALPQFDPSLNFGIQAAIAPTQLGYDGRRYACPACGGATKKKENLENHIKAKHLGLREHECPVCQYKMGTGYDVLDHIRATHGAEYLPEKTRDVRRKEDLASRVGSKRRRVGESIEETVARKRGRTRDSRLGTDSGFEGDDEYVP